MKKFLLLFLSIVVVTLSAKIDTLPKLQLNPLTPKDTCYCVNSLS